MDDVPPEDDEEEEESQHHVAQVAEDVVERTERSQRVGAQEVVVADVLVSRHIHDLLTRTLSLASFCS